MDGTLVGGIFGVAALALAPVVVYHLALHGESGLRWLWSRRPGDRRPPPAPRSPVEQLAADLRRLYPAVHTPVPGTRMAKQRGVAQVYDERLAAAASALEVTTSLLELDLGSVDRELERLRAEHLLMDAGLQLRP